MKDYYSILGISRSASESEIKRAYRKLAITYHPDKNNDSRAQEIFVEITEAYDVISDPVKRHAYDQLLENPFAHVLVEEPPQPRHRDPAYRRRQPANAPPVRKTSETYELMKEYLHYFYWLCWAGVGIVFLFAIDYFLPYVVEEERIDRIYAVHGKRGTAYHVAVTELGHKIKHYYGSEGLLFENENISWARTRIFSSPMWAEHPDGSDRILLAHIYGPFVFIPFVLLIISCVGIWMKDTRIDFCFNCSIVSGVLMILFWIFL